VATYKLIQDIEAEDHILGPLSLRQFIFAIIAAFGGYLCFFSITKHADFLLLIFFPPTVFFGFFAVPFGRDQPTEIWALAKIRYYLKPRKRIWDQTGVKELVTINVPKKIERALTNGLSENEVSSRLRVLADTLDSRGWSVKNIQQPNLMRGAFGPQSQDSERLLNISAPLQSDSDYGEPEGADILNEDRNNVISNHMQQMINDSTEKHKQNIINQMNRPYTDPNVAPANDQQWFMQSAAPSTQIASPVNGVRQLPQSLLRPVANPVPVAPVPLPPSNTLKTGNDPAIISLASRDDFTVDTIAREAKRITDNESNDGEVVISLH
jgi:hypothetical protein